MSQPIPTVSVHLEVIRAKRVKFENGRLSLLQRKKQLTSELAHVEQDLLATGGAVEGLNQLIADIEADKKAVETAVEPAVQPAAPTPTEEVTNDVQ